MASEIQVAHAATGKPLYALVRGATGAVWRTTTGAFVPYATANLADYAIALAEQGTASRYYAGPFPAAAAGTYAVAVYEQAGAAPTEGDPLVAGGDIEWDGAAVVPLATRATAAAVWASATRTLTAFGFSVAVATVADKAGYQLDLAQPLPLSPTTGSTGEALKLADTRLDAAVGTRLAAAAYTAPDNAAVAGIKAQTDRLSFDASNHVNARTKTSDDKAGYTATVGAYAAGQDPAAVLFAAALPASPAAGTAGEALRFAGTRLDAAVSSRLAAAGYTAPSNADVAAIKAQTDRLSFDASNHVNARTKASDDKAGYSATVAGYAAGQDPATLLFAAPLPGAPAAGTAGAALKLADTRLDATVSSRLAAAGYTAPDNAAVGAIKAKTDQLTFSAGNAVDAAVRSAADLAQAAADKVWASAARTLTAFGFAVTVGTNADKTGYGLDFAQALPASPATASLGEALKRADVYLDAAVSSRLPTVGYTAPDYAAVAAVKAQTDRLSFDASNHVNARTKTSDDKAGYTVTALAPGALDAGAVAAAAADLLADALLDRAAGVEPGFTVRQALRLILAALAGRLTGAAGAQVVIRDVNDTTDRIAAFVDPSGNRLTLSLNAD